MPKPETLTTADYVRLQLEAMSGTEWEDHLVAHARAWGWLVHHDRPARTEKGWRTAIAGDPGYPDLTMVHAARGLLLFIECKTGKATLSKEQRVWVAALEDVGSVVCDLADTTVVVQVWRPSDWDRICRIIEGEG